MNEPIVVDDEGLDLTPGAATLRQRTLFRTDDPVEVAKRATEVADALQGILRAKKLTTTIQGREHVRVEGWQTLGAMLGVTPVCTWTRPIEKGWEARVEARTLDGRVIGAAEAMCTRDEKTWANRDDYALRSMAQTRATSKALGSPLRFVVTLAGYDGTPAEEIATTAPGGTPLAIADEDATRAAKRALIALVGDADSAAVIWANAINGFGGVIPEGFCTALVATQVAADEDKRWQEMAADDE